MKNITRVLLILSILLSVASTWLARLATNEYRNAQLVAIEASVLSSEATLLNLRAAANLMRSEEVCHEDPRP